MNNSIEMDFIQAIKEAGLEPPDNIGLDGRFHRFSSDGRPSDNPGWYVLNVLPDCAIAGAFGCWRNGLKKTIKHGMQHKTNYKGNLINIAQMLRLLLRFFFQLWRIF